MHNEIILIELYYRRHKKSGCFVCNGKFSLITRHHSVPVSKLKNILSNNIIGSSITAHKDTSLPKPKVIMRGVPSRRNDVYYNESGL